MLKNGRLALMLLIDITQIYGYILVQLQIILKNCTIFQDDLAW